MNRLQNRSSLPLQNGRVMLRHFQPADIDALLAYRNDRNVAQYQSWDSMRVEEAVELVTEMATAMPGVPGTWFQFAVALVSSNTLIGDVGIYVNEDRRLGEIGYTLAAAYQGQGYGTEAVAAVMKYAFHHLQMHRLTATVDTRNESSIRLLERLGFRREGHFLSAAWFKGEWTDEYLYAILAAEYDARG